MGIITMAEECLNDLIATIDPVSTGCGVYDFTGKEEFCWAEHNCSTSAADVATMSKCWWDGVSAGWSTDDDFAALIQTQPAHKMEGNGLKCMLQRRSEFGDGGSQHIVTGRQGKKGIIVAHANFTCIVGYFDEDAGFPAGPVALAVEGLIGKYKEDGF